MFLSAPSPQYKGENKGFSVLLEVIIAYKPPFLPSYSVPVLHNIDCIIDSGSTPIFFYSR